MPQHTEMIVITIYADNAATTQISPVALDAMTSCMEHLWANPSSLHSAGRAASEALQKAREALATCIGAQGREITVTSGGTEAVNQAIRSAAAWGKPKGKRHIVSTAFEHHAVLHTLRRLEQEGFEVTLMEVGEMGVVSPRQVSQAIRADTCLVSVMYANNEVGTIQPISQIGAICRKQSILFHTDAVQAAGHLPIDVEAQQIDLLSLSAHKFYGPKGVGALYARKGIPLVNLLEGGAQERGKRPGTENLPAIAGMAAALKEACCTQPEHATYVAALRDRLIAGLLGIPGAVLNGNRENRLPGNVSVCFEGVVGEDLLLLLDRQGICASSGSACASGSLEPSHVLLAIGRSPSMARGALRLSLCHKNTPEEVESIIKAVQAAIEHLRPSKAATPGNPVSQRTEEKR